MITEEEILEIAVLSKLYVPEEQLEQLTKDMAETSNTAGAQVEVYEGLDGLSNVFREDEVEQSYPIQEILQNVGGGENGYFPVHKSR